MCSMREVRLAMIGEAIDDVATRARTGSGGDATMDDLTGRLAGIWAMVTELDPGLASRLRGYCAED
jgi:hypothetical protein